MGTIGVIHSSKNLESHLLKFYTRKRLKNELDQKKAHEKKEVAFSLKKVSIKIIQNKKNQNQILGFKNTF